MPTLRSSISIRLANENDLEKLVHFNQCIARETEGIELLTERLRQGVRHLLDDSAKGFYLVCEVEQQVVACLMITKEWSDWRNGDFWWIQSVYVEQEFRRQGIYRSLYEHVRQLSEKRPDVCGFRLYVEQNNERAQSTYSNLGMQKTRYLLFEELKPNVIFHR